MNVVEHDMDNERIVETAPWATKEDADAFLNQMLAYGSGYSMLGKDGKRRFLDINDFRLKPEAGD